MAKTIDLNGHVRQVEQASQLLDDVRDQLLKEARHASGLGGVTLLERLARDAGQLVTQVHDLGNSIAEITVE